MLAERLRDINYLIISHSSIVAHKVGKVVKKVGHAIKTGALTRKCINARFLILTFNNNFSC